MTPEQYEATIASLEARVADLEKSVRWHQSSSYEVTLSPDEYAGDTEVVLDDDCFAMISGPHKVPLGGSFTIYVCQNCEGDRKYVELNPAMLEKLVYFTRKHVAAAPAQEVNAE